MFRLSLPTSTGIAKMAVLAERSPQKEPRFLGIEAGLKPPRPPLFFVHDFASCPLGKGAMVFENARHAFEHWKMFDLGWVRVEDPTVHLRVGAIVAVRVHALGLWSFNHSRILEVVATPTRFGFVYGTTEIHVENGEERFLLEFDPSTEEVTYTLEAVSCPRSALAWLGYPVTRSYQHRFAEDSQRRMQDAV